MAWNALLDLVTTGSLSGLAVCYNKKTSPSRTLASDSFLKFVLFRKVKDMWIIKSILLGCRQFRVVAKQRKIVDALKQ